MRIIPTQHFPTTAKGKKGELFYDEVAKQLRVGDGVTPGGIVISGTNVPVEIKNYTHWQNIPEKKWTIDHNLGRFPNATVMDSAGTIVEGAITYVNPYRMIIEFSVEFSGSVYLN